MNHRLKILLLLLIGVLFQTGCGTDAAYTEESFSSDSPFKLRVDSDIEAACESARRSLLGQGYLIDLASSEEVKGRKAARVEGQQNAFIEMTVVCVPERGGSTVFATGVLSTYDLKKNSSSASVGLSALGSISLPIGQSVDSLVKVSEQTIDDKEFYKRFFTAVETILGEMRIRDADDDPATEPVQESAAQEAGQPVAQPRIWPELFPEQGESVVTPELSSGQVPEAAPVVAPAPVAPVPVPEIPPAPVAPVTAIAPEVSPAPVAVPEPAPQVAPVVIAPTPAPAPIPAVNETPPGVVVPAPAVNETPSTIPPTPVAVEAPAEVMPTVVPDAAPVVMEPAIASAPTTSTVAVPELAPVQVTAVRKVAPIPAVEQQAAPAGEPQGPATKIDGLF